MKKHDYDWTFRLAREVWRDVRRLEGLAWAGRGQPEILAVGDGGLAERLWGTEGAKVRLQKAHVGTKLGGDAHYDRVVVCGALELAPDGLVLLEQVAKVLRPDGVALVVVANRNSPWVWWRYSPWNKGRPYSKGQLEDEVRAAGLKVLVCRHGVLVPPARSAWVWRLRGVWRTLMRALCPSLGGVIVLVAGKEVGGAKALKRENGKGTVAPVPVGVSLFSSE